MNRREALTAIGAATISPAAMAIPAEKKEEIGWMLEYPPYYNKPHIKTLTFLDNNAKYVDFYGGVCSSAKEYAQKAISYHKGHGLDIVAFPVYK